MFRTDFLLRHVGSISVFTGQKSTENRGFRHLYGKWWLNPFRNSCTHLLVSVQNWLIFGTHWLHSSLQMCKKRLKMVISDHYLVSLSLHQFQFWCSVYTFWLSVQNCSFLGQVGPIVLFHNDFFPSGEQPECIFPNALWQPTSCCIATFHKCCC